MSASSDGRLAIVLHTHMPYVEGFGTWPFGEEWLWEAVATVYVPLLDLLARDAPLTLSLTPVLGDQLAVRSAEPRLHAFLRELRAETHTRDAERARASGDHAVAAELARACGDYTRAADRLEALGPGGLGRALAAHATWTSSATHAILPLMATPAGVALQLETGIAGHRTRARDAPGAPGWRGGLWLPECAHAPWLDGHLARAGVQATCVDLTDAFGPGASAHLQPLATAAGPLLVPIDRATIELVWSEDGYPAHAAYRNSHHFTEYRHRPWANDGAVYDRDRALEQAARDAEDFVRRTSERVAGGGLAVCALDTELLGHFWYEGQDWLAAVLDEAPRHGLEILALDDALDEAEPVAVPAAGLPTTTWGTPRTLRTWSGPQVADLAFATRAAELDVLGAEAGRADQRALRELLALQSSDWAFLITNDTAGPYPRERAEGHGAALRQALAAPGTMDPALRGLAPHLGRAGR